LPNAVYAQTAKKPQAATAKKTQTNQAAKKPQAAAKKPQAAQDTYKKAFTAMNKGNFSSAASMAATGKDPLLNKILTGYVMAQPDNNHSFMNIISFIEKNPSWSGIRGIQLIAEQKMPDDLPTDYVLKFFKDREPVSLGGFYKYMNALYAGNQHSLAEKEIRKKWQSDSFLENDQLTFYNRFSNVLRYEDVHERVDSLLWKSDFDKAHKLIPMLSHDDQALALTRIAFAKEDRNIAEWLEQVPRNKRSDEGLLYQQLRLLVKQNRNDEAIGFLENIPDTLKEPKIWWSQTNTLARRAMRDGNFELAYKITSNHRQPSGNQLLDAEFLSGFLALRKLNNPDRARRHFAVLYKNASMPISRARGAYWMGRAYEALSDSATANDFYKEAALLGTTFYGQLAITKVYEQPLLVTKDDPKPSAELRKNFMNRDEIRAITALNNIGESERAAAFLRAAINRAESRHEFLLLTEIAASVSQPDLGIQAVKTANRKGILMLNGAFPMLEFKVPTAPEKALILAIIKQESQFNKKAVSPSGAKGLMQLMPGTAKETAKRHKMPYNAGGLHEGPYNVQLGSSYLARQIDNFGGSYIAAIAGYNAGPTRAREWIETFGDPRNGNVDPIDWLELISIEETRNYVQRVMENLQIYRSKLADDKAPLRITEDIMR